MKAMLAAIAVTIAVMMSSRADTSAGPRDGNDDGQWPMYSGSYRSERFSPLTQISPENIKRLHPLWLYQPPGAGALEVTPLVVDGMMYVTTGMPATVAALDLTSGRPIWEWSRPVPDTVRTLGFARVNRGVAILDGTVFVG